MPNSAMLDSISSAWWAAPGRKLLDLGCGGGHKNIVVIARKADENRSSA
jgi:cyclopropane fatty-acyl-phospholipid synthase-like methyltransferase